MDLKTKIKRDALIKLDELVSFELKRLNDGALPLKSFTLQSEGLFSEEEIKEIWPSLYRLNTPGYVAFYCNIRCINSPLVEKYYKRRGIYPR